MVFPFASDGDSFVLVIGYFPIQILLGQVGLPSSLGRSLRTSSGNLLVLHSFSLFGHLSVDGAPLRFSSLLPCSVIAGPDQHWKSAERHFDSGILLHP